MLCLFLYSFPLVLLPFGHLSFLRVVLSDDMSEESENGRGSVLRSISERVNVILLLLLVLVGDS